MAEHLSAQASVVVVGGGLAGLRTVAELRRAGFGGRVTVVAAEPHPPYDRPPLSKHLLSHPAPTWLADDLGTDLAELADQVLFERHAVDLDLGGPRVVIAGPDGARRTLAADAVVLACGARPVHPPQWSDVLTLRTLEDAARLREALREGTRLVVVGAGWIGAEVAGVAAGAGCEVTVLEALPAPLARQVGVEVGGLTVPWYSAAGVELHTGVQVTSVAGGVVETDAGEHRADAVLAAVGVRPATAWLASTLPLSGHGAVMVDPTGRVLDATGAPLPEARAVRAVGDCADMVLPSGAIVPGGHWDGALHHPEALAADLLGQTPPAPPAPYVFSTQLGHELTLFGQPSPLSRVVLRGDPTGAEGWTALFVEEDDGAPRLVAGFTVDRPRDVGALRSGLAGGATPALDVDAAREPAVQLRRALVG